MNRGAKKLLVAASFAAAGCTAAPDAVEIRPIGGAGAKLRAADDPLAAAKGQLALGNVALALEGFRKAARENPQSAEALTGMAACYERMGRFDVAEAKYEAALALAPRNPALLTALAGVLDRLGRADDAAEVRGEIAQLNAASRMLDTIEAEAEPAVAVAPIAVAATVRPAPSVTVALPAPIAAAAPAKAVAATNGATRAAPPVAASEIVAKLPAPRIADRAHVALNAAPLQFRGGRIDQQALVTFELANDLPAPRLEPAVVRLDARPLQVREGLLQFAPMTVELGMDAPAPLIRQRPAVKPPVRQAPRLERLSLGEVALLTGTGPVWRGQVVASTPQKLTVRWVPLATASARPSIRLLNAARWQGLAARSRSYLIDRGWRKIEIGDARQTRAQSLVLYPAQHEMIGRRLAAQFGFRSRAVPGSSVFLVLLGRDSRLRPTQQRG